MNRYRSTELKWLVPEWPAPRNVRSLSTLRVGGSSRPPYSTLNLGDHVGDAPIAVAKNRRSLREAAGLPANPLWLTQVHGIRVADFDDPGSAQQADRESADAAVTSRPGNVCAILAADCLPVLFAAESGDRVGAAHAGWRGLAGGVIEATVKTMAVPPRELLAWLGPAIGPRHFEVGPEVREAFLHGGDSDAAAAFEPNDRGAYMADLYALARRRLACLGVERVYGGGECTYSQADKYFSHRRDGKNAGGQTGRQATLIWLERSG